MRLILADAPNISAGIPIATIAAALSKVQSFQALFAPGQPLASIGSLIDTLFGADAAERSRFEALIPVVKADLANNYRLLTGQNLWNDFTAEKSNWLQTALNNELQAATAKYNVTRDRVNLRYIKVFQTLTEENRIRLIEAQRAANLPGAGGGQTTPETKNLETIGLVVAGLSILTRFLK